MVNKARTIVVTNRKGGVGKTTMTVHLASSLALLGYRVGIVDTDSQGHCALAFGMKKENGLFNLYSDDGIFVGDVARQVPMNTYVPEEVPVDWQINPQPLYLIPGSKQTSAIPAIDGYSPFRFNEIVQDFADDYQLQYVFVDTGPTYNPFDVAVNFTATDFLYVTEPSYASIDGITGALAELKKLNDTNRQYRNWNSEVMGVITNKAMLRTIAHRDQTGTIATHLKNLVWSPVPHGIVWQEAFNVGMSIFAYAPLASETARAWALATKFIQVVQHA